MCTAPGMGIRAGLTKTRNTNLPSRPWRLHFWPAGAVTTQGSAASLTFACHPSSCLEREWSDPRWQKVCPWIKSC